MGWEIKGNKFSNDLMGAVLDRCYGFMIIDTVEVIVKNVEFKKTKLILKVPEVLASCALRSTQLRISMTGSWKIHENLRAFCQLGQYTYRLGRPASWLFR